MRPTFSIIFFTVMSGAGYGLLFLLGLRLALDPSSVGRSEALVLVATGAVFAAAGLTSSLLHLGQPQRAWRALSQWRSSWLSREGVVAIASFVPVVLIGAGLLGGTGTGWLRGAGAALALLAALTVYCTSGIYTSLKTIHAWHNRYVLPGYLLFALLGGASWLWTIVAFTRSGPAATTIALPATVALLAIGCAALKLAYWRFIDTTQQPATIESATGLGRLGSVRSAEAPHTEANYLTHEMGFALARKHARRLRSVCLALIGATPTVLCACAAAWPALVLPCACITAVCATAGTFVERWLFFAQAKHVVMLYYDSRPTPS